MGLFIKEKFVSYKKFRLDIWGVVRNSFFIEKRMKKI